MKPTFQLLGTPFFASLFLSWTREPGSPGTVAWAARDVGVARMVKATEILGVWAEKDLHYVILDAEPLSWVLKQLFTECSQVLTEPGLCFWNIASSDTLHMWMCRTLCFVGLQISIRFNSAGFLGSTFPQQQNPCPPLPYLLYEVFLH